MPTNEIFLESAPPPIKCKILKTNPISLKDVGSKFVKNILYVSKN